MVDLPNLFTKIKSPAKSAPVKPEAKTANKLGQGIPSIKDIIAPGAIEVDFDYYALIINFFALSLWLVIPDLFPLIG